MAVVLDDVETALWSVGSRGSLRWQRTMASSSPAAVATVLREIEAGVEVHVHDDHVLVQVNQANRDGLSQGACGE